MAMYRKNSKAVDGVTTIIHDEYKPVEHTVDLSNVKDVPFGYDDDTDALIPLRNITLDTVSVAEELEVKGMTYLDDDVVVGAGLSVRGDLVVDGTTYTTEEESLDTSSDYVVLRHNNVSGLANNEHSGIVVNNYANGKNASIAVDREGTWRVADNTSETVTKYTAISQYDGKYYDSLQQTTEVTVAHGAPVAQDVDELSEVVYYNNKYYKYDNVHWFEVSLTDDTLYFDIQSPITDKDTIAALEAEDKADLFYYRSLKIMTIDDSQNEPLLTRDESENLPDGTLLKWDADSQKAVAIDNQPQINGQALIAKIGQRTTLYKLDDDFYSFNGDTCTEAEEESGTPEITDVYNTSGSFIGYILTDDGELYEEWSEEGAPNYYLKVTGFQEVQIPPSYDTYLETITESTTEEPTGTYIDSISRYVYGEAGAITYDWGESGGGGVSFKGTKAEYEVAKLIPEGQEGYIAAGTIVIITDETDYLKGEDREEVNP